MWQSAMGRMVALEKSGVEVSPKTLANVYFVQAYLKVGVLQTNPKPSKKQLLEGLALYRKMVEQVSTKGKLAVLS